MNTHGLLFFLFTNKYLFHAVIVLITIVTVGSQLRARSVAASDGGKQTLLYLLVTDGEDVVIEEQMRPELLTKNTQYLGADTIEAFPDIDYDYEDMPIADISLDGNIEPLPGELPQPDRYIARTKTEIYEVQSGDTIASIAYRFGVTTFSVTESNGLNPKSPLIRPGDKLKIPPVSGILHVIKQGDTIEKLAQKYSIKAEDIYTANRLSSQSILALNEEIVLPGAVPPETPVTKPIATKPTTSKQPTRPVAIRPDVPLSTIKNKSVDVYQELKNTDSDTRAKPEDKVEEVKKTKLLWPTRQRVITQYYGWKHTGVDLDGDYTDPIYASEDGVVETAGWNNGGYGLQIVINHENGMRTRYAHASKMFVKVGDRVKRGQVIAMVGTTGRSTGTHLHYEVYVNNKRVNPLSYTK
jgi:murein DD-endopeptidase MepM/ murein hydrolase activator NlpD